jgi:hypothetical protein
MLRQKEKLMKNQICFTQCVSEFKQSKAREQKRKNQLEQKARAAQSQAQKTMKKRIESILPRAVANLCKVICQDKGFGSYLVWLFETRAISFDDGTGSCGFQPRPRQYMICHEASSIANVKVEAKQLIGSREDYDAHVSVLVLYREYERKRNLDPLHARLHRDADIQNGPVLALTALRSHQFCKPEIDQIKDFRLVMVYEEIDRRLMTSDYSALPSMSLDPGFADTLHKLSSPTSAFKFLLNKFGPMA